MALLATGLSNDITHIHFQEFLNAEPGLLLPTLPQFHWKPELRNCSTI